jgi:hypothetical protein
LATTLQVSYALLMKGLREMVVHTPAIVDQRARPVEPEQLLSRLVAAGWVDHVTRFMPTNEDVQPGRATSDAPARLVGRDL